MEINWEKQLYLLYFSVVSPLIFNVALVDSIQPVILIFCTTI